MFCAVLIWTLLLHATAASAQSDRTTLRIEVRSSGEAVSGAEVTVGDRTYVTDATGTVNVTVASGLATITVLKKGYLPVTASVTVAPGNTQPVLVDLEKQPTL